MAGPPEWKQANGWAPGLFFAETVSDLLAEARVRPPHINLECAAERLELIALDLEAGEPPRPEEIARWAERLEAKARELAELLGCDLAALAVGGAGRAMGATDLLEAAMIEADDRSDLAELARSAGAFTPLDRARLLRQVPESVGLVMLAAREGADFWRKHTKGGRSRLFVARALIFHTAGAYRAATGREPGVKPDGPAVRFALCVAAFLRKNLPSTIVPLLTSQGAAELMKDVGRGNGAADAAQ